MLFPSFLIIIICFSLSFKALNIDLRDLDGFAGRVAWGANLHPAYGLVVISSEVLPAHDPLVCEIG